MQPMLQCASNHEQRCRGEAMRDHLHDGPLKGKLGPGKHTNQHEPHVANAAVRDQPFEV